MVNIRKLNMILLLISGTLGVDKLYYIDKPEEDIHKAVNVSKSEVNKPCRTKTDETDETDEYDETDFDYITGTEEQIDEPGCYLYSNIQFASKCLTELLATLGAEGETADELGLATYLPTDVKIIEELQKYLSFELIKYPRYELNIRNRLYVGAVKPKNNYTETTNFTFYADLYNLRDVSQIPIEINKWIADQTDNQIEPIPKRIDLILANTVSFFEEWKNIFLEYKRGRFFTSKYVTIIKYMDTIGDYKYFHDTSLEYKVVELPFVSDRVSLIIIVPTRDYDIFESEEVVSNIVFNTFKANFKVTKNVHVSIPQKLFQGSSNIKFKLVLQNFGVKLAFSNNANFSKISENILVKIDEIVQETSIKVNMHGAFISSASANIMERTNREPNFYVYAESEFMYFLKHETFGILFMGKFINP